MQDTRRQAVIALRWLPLILLGALAAGALAYAYASEQPKVYEATARLLVNPGPDPDLQSVALAQSVAVRYADQALSRSVAEAVIEELGLTESPESLMKRVSTSTSEETLELTIDARDGTPEAASLLALALGDEMRDRVKDLITTDEVKAADAAIAANQQSVRTLQNRLNQLTRKPTKTFADRSEIIALAGQISALQLDIQATQPSSRAFVRNRLDWVERPTAPESPTEPRPLYWTLLALVVGGMLAAAVAFVLEYLRSFNKVRDERDMEAATGVRAAGSVFEKRGDIKRGDAERLVMLRYPRSEAAEAYRGLLARIAFAGGSARTLMVAGAGSSDGKSAVAANLALAYAEAGRNVILVDADYRSPRLHSFFGVPNDRGVTNVLVDFDVPLPWVIVPTAHPRLRLMPAGPPPPKLSGPLGARQVDALIGSLLQVADTVVFDSPPIAGSLDAAVLATHLHGAVLVVPVGARADDAADAALALQGAQAEVLGTVLYRGVRGSHKRSQATPVTAVPPGPNLRPSASPYPPRRIPAVASATDRPEAGRPSSPPPPGNPQSRSPASVGANPPGAAVSTHSAGGPYDTALKPSRSSSD